MNSAPCLTINGLEKRYPSFTLGPVSLSVPSGSIFGLIGPNGAGKTTLIDAIFGMANADAGTIELCGLDHRRDEVSLKHRAAYVGPELTYGIWGTVAKAMRFIRGFRPTWDDAYAAQLLQKWELNPATSILTLSFGGRMKLALVLAMAWHPKVLILDEPTTGLDAQAKHTLFSELLALVKDESRTVILSSHQLTDMERFADRVGILHRGKLLVDGDTSELIERFVRASFHINAPLPARAGLTVKEQDGTYCLALVDTRQCPLAELSALGATDLTTQPLTLEELFLSLTN